MEGYLSSKKGIRLQGCSSIRSTIWDKIKQGIIEPQAAEKIKDPALIKKTYSFWRTLIFISMYLSYVVFYLCRKNISVAQGPMAKEFGLSNTEIGLLGGTLYITYAIGKFVNGVLADRANVRIFTPIALSLSGLMNIALAVSSIFITANSNTIFGLPPITILLWTMAFLWGLNGWFQSGGFPPAAKSLTYWFSNKERGIKWSLWSTSHEIGTWLSVLLSGFLIVNYGWRAVFYVPGIFAILFSIILFRGLRDKPQSLGLPDIEEYHNTSKNVCHSTCEHVKTENENIDKNDIQDKEPEEGYFEIFKKHIIFNKTVWLLALAYIFVYIVRYGTLDWVLKFLVESKGNSIEVAVSKLSFLPLFGTIGTASAGFVSDKFFGGRRAPVNILYLTGVVLAIFGLKTFNGTFTDIMFLGLIGIFTCGPQVLIGGLCAVESSSKKVASAVTGFTGSFGYLGAFLSGTGTGLMVDKFGWNGAINYWIISAIFCIVLCIPLWNNCSKLK